MPHTKTKVAIKRKPLLSGWKARRSVLNRQLPTFGKQRTLTIPLRAYVRMQNK